MFYMSYRYRLMPLYSPLLDLILLLEYLLTSLACSRM
jgi:hypothetical protein